MKRRLRSILVMAVFTFLLLGGDLLYTRHNLGALVRRELSRLRVDLAPCSLEVGRVRAGSWREAELSRVRLSMARGGEPIFSARKVSAHLTLGALVRGQVEEVVFEGADLLLHRDARGEWNLPSGRGEGARDGKLPIGRVRLLNTTLTLVDDFLFEAGTEHVIWVEDLSLALTPGGGIEIRNGEFDLKGVGKVRIEHLLVDRTEGILHGKIGLEEIDLEEAFPSNLPRGELSSIWEKTQPAGRVRLELELDLDLRTGEVGSVAGLASFRGVRLQSSWFPYPVEDLAGTVELKDQRLEINLGGSFGDGDLELSGKVESPWASPEIHLQARIEEMVADDTLREAVAALGEGKTYDEFQPTGPFRLVEISLERSGATGEEKLILRLHPRKVSMAYVDFPYRISEVQAGELTIEISRPPGVAPGEEPITVTLAGLHGRHGDGRILGEGTWKRSREGVHLDLRILGEEVEMAADLQEAVGHLGSVPAEVWEEFDPSGPTNVEVRLQREPGEKLEARIDAEFQGCSIHPHRVGLSLEKMSGSLSLTPRGFKVVGVRGVHEGSEVRLEGEGLFVEDDFTGRFRVEAEGLEMGEEFRRFLAGLSREAGEIYEEFQPGGTVGGEVVLVKTAGTPEPRIESLTLTPQGAEIRYKRFPYPFADLRGEAEVDVDTGVISIPGLFARLPGGGEAFLRGEVRAWGAEEEMDLRLAVAGLSLDETLRWALSASPGGQKVWDIIDPEGAVRGSARILRRGGGAVEIQGEAELVGVACRVSEFPYRVRHLEGPVLFDLEVGPDDIPRGPVILGRGDGETPIRGRRGKMRVSAWGEITLGDGDPELGIRIRAQDLQLDRVLREAMPPEARDQFDAFEPAGTADVEAIIRMGPEGQGVDWEARLNKVQLSYKPLPLPLEEVEGLISMREEELAIRDVRGRNGETTVVVDGYARRDGDLLVLSIRAERVPLVERIRRLLPDSLARTWQDLALEGGADLHLRLHREEEEFLIVAEAWAREMTVQFGEEGLRFEGLDGLVQGAGRLAEDRSVLVTGHIEDVSGTYKKRPMKERSAHFTYQRGAGDGATGDLVYTDIDGTIIGGRLTGEIGLHLGSDVEYQGRLRLEGGRLEQALAPLEKSSEATGLIDASLEFEGKGGDPDSTRGAGKIVVTRGDFIKIPAVSGMLEELDRQENFDTMELRLKLGGQEANVRMILSRPALSVSGRGEVGYDGTLDIIVVPELGRPWLAKIWGVSWLVDWLKGTVAAAKVEGTLDNPEVRYYPLVGLSKWIEGWDD